MSNRPVTTSQYELEDCFTLSCFVRKCMLLYEFYSILVSGYRENALEDLDFPMIQLDLSEQVNQELFKLSINQLVLGIVFINSTDFTNKIRGLSQFFHHNYNEKVILVAETDNNILIEEVLNLCWKSTLPNVILFEISSNRIFSFSPYPTFKISHGNADLFPEKIQNMYGAPMTIALVYDPPRKFKYYDRNQRFNGGYAWHILNEFTKRLNITIIEKYDYDELNKNVLESAALYVNGSVDFIPSLAFRHADNQSYFLEYFTMYQIVPLIKDIDTFWYLLSIFSIKSWIGFTFLILMSTVLLSIANKIVYGKYEIFAHYRASTRILFFQQSVSSRLFKPKISVIYGFTLFINLIVVTTYHSSTGSSLTEFKSINQIHNFEELKHHNIKMAVADEELQMIKAGQIPSFIPLQYSDQMVSFKYTDYVKLWDSMNTNFAYVIPSDKWMMFYYLQLFKKNFIFRVMEDKSSRTYRPVSLPFGKTSIYRYAYHMFLIHIYSAGLVSKWTADSAFEMSKGDLLFDMEHQPNNNGKPLSLQYYLLPLYLLGTCSLISFAFLIGEILNERRLK